MKNYLLLPFAGILLVGCANWSSPLARLDPHRIEVQQGNVLTQEVVAKLKPGMTPSQVRYLLGTPLIVDPFHSDRWDYVYSLRQGGRLVGQRHITALFEHDRLMAIKGDVVPAEESAQ